MDFGNENGLGPGARKGIAGAPTQSLGPEKSLGPVWDAPLCGAGRPETRPGRAWRDCKNASHLTSIPLKL